MGDYNDTTANPIVSQHADRELIKSLEWKVRELEAHLLRTHQVAFDALWQKEVALGAMVTACATALLRINHLSAETHGCEACITITALSANAVLDVPVALRTAPPSTDTTGEAP